MWTCIQHFSNSLLLPASQDYPGDEILLVYDYSFAYGENYYVCLTEEAKELVLNVRV